MILDDLLTVQQETIAKLSSELVGTPFNIEHIGGGRNSRIYRLSGVNATSYVVKVYLREPGDSRDRLGTEFNSLTFLWQQGIHNIPRPMSSYPESGIALYEYIVGDKLFPESVTNSEVDAAVDFAAQLKMLTHEPAAALLNPASEAYFSIEAILNNIQRRLSRLSQDQIEAMLVNFLERELLPTLDCVNSWISKRASRQQELPGESRVLSPSDFGFHNAIRRNQHEIVFLDFEYFGWDDPAKLISDFLLHPAMNLNQALARRFACGIVEKFQAPEWLLEHVKTVYPLFGIKWCLICLNEFLPEHRRRRQFAAGAEQDWAIVYSQQLSKARQILQRINGEYEQFPYFD